MAMIEFEDRRSGEPLSGFERIALPVLIVMSGYGYRSLGQNRGMI